MDNKQQDFLAALATSVLEKPVEEVTPDCLLEPWDSMAVVSTIAVIDDVYGKFVDGKALAACVTAADILKLVEA